MILVFHRRRSPGLGASRCSHGALKQGPTGGWQSKTAVMRPQYPRVQLVKGVKVQPTHTSYNPYEQCDTLLPKYGKRIAPFRFVLSTVF